MIDYIKGEITELAPTRMVLECGNIGYEINISLNTFSAMSGRTSCKIFIYESIREDAHLLYGFSEKIERDVFILLLSVSGVGPNTARMMLSSMPPQEIARAIRMENAKALTAAKGIGLKTAQRIIVDLKSKMDTLSTISESVSEVTHSDESVQNEAVAALVMLGFQKTSSEKVVYAILQKMPDATVEDVIKQALRML